jgi:glyoxylase-like metal-dependent hydrolase (beta-lactamase superfamily II)
MYPIVRALAPAGAHLEDAMPSTAPHRAAAPPAAPGVTRLGDAEVNFYLVDDPGGLVLVDGGMPGHLPQLRSHLEGAGRSLGDIRAVLLTHAHPDHTGVAAAARQAGADIWVHERDAAGLAGGARVESREAKPERSLLPYLLRRPATLRMIAYAGRMGGFSGSKVSDPRTVAGDQRLDNVPGRPRVLPLPGHTPGSVGYLFADRGLLFTGDALVTYDGTTGHHGPTIISRAFTHDSREALASLTALAAIDAGLLLPGHGEPFPGTPADAAAQARGAGAR